jgi:hypothetical protein
MEGMKIEDDESASKPIVRRDGRNTFPSGAAYALDRCRS